MQVQAWHDALVAAAVLNPILLLLATRAFPLSTADPARRHYQLALRWLAVPMVVECGWRGVFPSLYLQRFTFYDTPLNSIILDRSLACVGEIAWTAQFSLVVWRLNDEVSGRSGALWVRVCAVAAVLMYVVAEGISYYNTATTNELWAAIEVVVDAAAWLVLLPATLRLAAQTWGLPGARSAKVFACMFSAVAPCYAAYNFGVDAPMYLRRFAADQAAGKKYLPFGVGLVDAAVRRVPTQVSEAAHIHPSYHAFSRIPPPLNRRPSPTGGTTCSG